MLMRCPMPDAVLVFTFSPVQEFITEARRAADLYAGSRILVTLAAAVASAIQASGGQLAFPAGATEDTPNKLVAVVPAADARAVADAAERALHDRWREIAATARARLAGIEPAPDAAWDATWRRQTDGFWQIYWAAAPGSYDDAYRRAAKGLDASKRTRAFAQAEEEGIKDSLSGRRSALRTRALDARAYWAAVGNAVSAAKLRPDGRERLDALGAVKRFGEIADRPFPSTSTVASEDFFQRSRTVAAEALHAYRDVVTVHLSVTQFRVRDDVAWPFDGDLFYPATITPASLQDRYGLDGIDEGELRAWRAAQRALLEAAASQPTPYYGIVALDGDGMGERIDACLQAPDPRGAHQRFSAGLSAFAARVRSVAEAHHAHVIYNGGDDVLLLAPLATSLPVARLLASTFQEVLPATERPATASAGIAIVHHLSPLDAALRAAREAEQAAKRVPDKAAVCVRVLKRSGELLEMRSSWDALGTNVDDLVALFRGDEAGQPLSSRIAYDLAATAEAFAEPGAAFSAELRRLLARHRDARHPRAPAPAEWSEKLATWANALPAPRRPPTGPAAPPAERTDQDNRVAELVRWLLFARFAAQGGGE